MKWILQKTEKFPKSQRFFLAKRINDAVFEFYELITEAAMLRDGRAGQRLRRADVRLLRLRNYLRLALDLKYINFRAFEHGTRELAELGALLGAWLRREGGRG